MSKLLKLFNLTIYTINQAKIKKYRKFICVFEKLVSGGLIVYFTFYTQFIKVNRTIKNSKEKDNFILTNNLEKNLPLTLFIFFGFFYAYTHMSL